MSRSHLLPDKIKLVLSCSFAEDVKIQVLLAPSLLWACSLLVQRVVGSGDAQVGLSGRGWASESGLIFLYCFLPCSPPTPFMPFTSTLPLPPAPPGPSAPDAEEEEDYDS